MNRPAHAPWRAGPPRFTVGLRPIDPASWLFPDSEAHALDWKAGLLARPQDVWRQAPDAGLAAHEAAALVCAEAGAPAGDLIAAAQLVSDDLVVMTRADDGRWLTGAIVLSAPTFFSVNHAFGRDLTALHGPVPDGEALAARIARVFDAVRPGQVLERFNWTLQWGGARFTPDAAPLRSAADAAPVSEACDQLHVRVERQTIIKLPATGAVLFTIRVCLDPVRALAADEIAALAQAWRGLGPEGRSYKGWAALERHAQAVFADL
ncbi:MAG: heme-dependent oxidative N-demethylase subunit alpha family protein [Oceanicaulis sp.]